MLIGEKKKKTLTNHTRRECLQNDNILLMMNHTYETRIRQENLAPHIPTFWI
jgi:hypothetical protein